MQHHFKCSQDNNHMYNISLKPSFWHQQSLHSIIDIACTLRLQRKARLHFVSMLDAGTTNSVEMMKAASHHKKDSSFLWIIHKNTELSDEYYIFSSYKIKQMWKCHQHVFFLIHTFIFNSFNPLTISTFKIIKSLVAAGAVCDARSIPENKTAE